MFEVRLFADDSQILRFESVQDCSSYISVRMKERAVELRKDYFETSWELQDLIDWLADGRFEECTAHDVLEDALDLIECMYADGVYPQDKWYLGFIRWVEDDSDSPVEES